MYQNRDQLHENRQSAYIFFKREWHLFNSPVKNAETKKWSQTDLFWKFKSLNAYIKYFNLHSLKILALLQRNVAVFWRLEAYYLTHAT